MNWIAIFFGAIVFVFGFLANQVFTDINTNITQFPESVGNRERISPQDHVAEDQILVYHDRVIIMLDNPKWAKYSDTNSMDPVLDHGANGIEIPVRNVQDIKVGDIIIYESKLYDALIVHRVVEIKSDEQGWYALTKGDNSPYKDLEKVRADQVRSLLVGIIY